jgi:hypothetical protein
VVKRQLAVMLALLHGCSQAAKQRSIVGLSATRSGRSRPSALNSITEVNVGQISGPTIIEGTTMSRDTYNIPRQAGAVGPHSRAHDMTFQQIQNNLDLPKLAEELGRLRTVMKQESQGTREQDKAVVAVAEAKEAAIRGDGPTALRHLKTAGKWTLGIAEKISATVAAEAIKMAMIGPP